MALFDEIRQEFVVPGVGVVIFWRLMVVGAAGYRTIILLPPPPFRERDTQLGHTPTTRQKGSCLLDGIWSGAVLAT